MKNANPNQPRMNQMNQGFGQVGAAQKPKQASLDNIVNW